MPDLDDLIEFLETSVKSGSVFHEYAIQLTARHYGMPVSQLYNLLAIYQEFNP